MRKTALPPYLARELLQRLVPGPHAESLIGDLDEQYAHKRSVGWYWRQATAAILIGMVKDIRRHPMLVFRAAILMVVVVIAWVESSWWVYLWMSRTAWLTQWASGSWHGSRVFWTFWELYGGGLTLLWCAGCAITGWIIARLHREHLAAMLAVSLSSVLFLALWWGGRWWLQSYAVSPTFRTSWRVVSLVALLGMPVSTLIGGLFAMRQSRSPS